MNMLKNNKYCDLSGDLTNIVFKNVMKVKNEDQTPDFKKQIGYQIYFLPSQNSKYKIYIPKNTVEEENNNSIVRKKSK